MTSNKNTGSAITFHHLSGSVSNAKDAVVFPIPTLMSLAVKLNSLFWFRTEIYDVYDDVLLYISIPVKQNNVQSRMTEGYGGVGSFCKMH